MTYIGLLLIGLCVAGIIYLFMDLEEEDDILERRLKSLSQHKELASVEKVNKESYFKKRAGELVAPIVNALTKKRQKVNTVKQLLIQAGRPSTDEDVVKLITQKVLYGIIGFVFALAIYSIGGLDAMMATILFIATPLTLYRLPEMKLKNYIKHKETEISYNLPDALDLLTVCVEAGLGLDAALFRVSQEQMRTCPILATELGRVSKDILAGVPRQEAFRNLANRNNVEDLRSLTSLLIQTDKLGTSIAQSLKVYSDTVRTRRRQKAEALAAKASVKMVIPLVLFILPSMFTVLLTPAFISLMDNFQNMSIGSKSQPKQEQQK